jgi:hypothetical protein
VRLLWVLNQLKYRPFVFISVVAPQSSVTLIASLMVERLNKVKNYFGLKFLVHAQLANNGMLSEIQLGTSNGVLTKSFIHFN